MTDNIFVIPSKPKNINRKIIIQKYFFFFSNIIIEVGQFVNLKKTLKTKFAYQQFHINK